MRSFVSALALITCQTLVAQPAAADPAADIRFLTDTLYSQATLDATFETLGPLLTAGISSQLQAQGVSVSDPARFVQIFIEEFRGSFLAQMRQEMQPVLRDRFSDADLAGIAEFLRSPAGQKFVAEQPGLMRAGGQIGQRVGTAAGIEAMGRVAERMDGEGIVFTGRNGQRLDPLQALGGR